ncbi:MAG: 3-oxoacyl-[acyl-carrier-protein] reductase [Ethanoligenens sp.]
MGKCALVTGASRSIGAAIALKLAQKGYNIAVGCHSHASVENGGEAVAAQCRELGVEAACFVADVADFSQCERMVGEVITHFGSIEALVNNAGITKDALLVQMSEEQYDSVISADLKSVFNMMRHAGKRMMKAKHGAIVNITSVAGLYGNRGQANYSAAKAGIVGMTKTAAKELGARGITVNAVAPGFIETPMTAAMPEKAREAALGSIALRRPGTCEDVANAVAFLVSEEAAYITGQVLVVDGCMTM